MKKYFLFAFIALFFVSSHSWAQYVKLTAPNGTVYWTSIKGKIIGTNIELYGGGTYSAFDRNTTGSIDLNEVWFQSGGKRTHYQVTTIGNGAFSGCSGLTSVTIPSSVTSIESSAFSGCNGLKKVIVKDIAAWCKIAFANSSSNPLYYANHLFSNR